jgi:hypothetical protein
VEVGIPKAFALYQNYPNPFNPTTIISYALPKGDRVTLRLYDLLGRVVKTLVDDSQDAGIYEVRFSATGGSASGGEASSIASGVYFYRLQAGSFVQTKKMLVVK